MRLSEKIIIISGAGISISAGYKLKLVYKIPLLILIYLVPTFKGMQKSKQTSFNHSLYSSFKEITSFYSIVRDIYKRLYSDLIEPLPFYKVIDKLI
jgi:hypothetical protein